MANHHTDEQQPPIEAQPSILTEFRRHIATFVLTALIAFLTSWWSNQMTLNDLRNRMDRLEEKQRDQAAADATGSQLDQQNMVKLAELSIMQQNLAEQLKEIKQTQEQQMRRR